MKRLSISLQRNIIISVYGLSARIFRRVNATKEATLRLRANLPSQTEKLHKLFLADNIGKRDGGDGER